MASTEMTAKPKQPEPPKVDHDPETAQNPSDSATTEHLQRTVGGVSELTDPAMKEILRVTSRSWDDLPVMLFEPKPFIGEWKE